MRIFRLSVTGMGAFAVVAAAAAVLIVGYFVVPGLLPKSGEERYEADRQKLQVAVRGYHSGFVARPARSASRAADLARGFYPTWARLKKGTDSSIMAENAGSEAITALNQPMSNPTGSKDQSGTPSWEDVNNDGKRDFGQEPLYYEAAVPEPAVDHWDTTTVTLNGTRYVVDSRDWFVNITVLIEGGFLKGNIDSASRDNSPAGSGSYSWYVDEDGEVRSMLYSFPKPETGGYQDVYP